MLHERAWVLRYSVHCSPISRHERLEIQKQKQDYQFLEIKVNMLYVDYLV